MGNDYIPPPHTMNYGPVLKPAQPPEITVDHTDDFAVLNLAKKRLVEVLSTSSNPNAIINAAERLLDRIEGKPLQRVDNRNLNASVSVPLSETDEAILRHYYETKYLPKK